MGTKRVGLARVEALIENLKREITLGAGTSVQGLALGAQAVTAAGNSQGTATAIGALDGSVVLVAGADGTKGVILPALADVGDGHIYLIQNNAGSTLEVYPASGDKVLPAADNAGITVAANAMLVCAKADGDQWVGFEPTVIAA